jgi:predicted O-methyltransferase YrrM
MSAETLNLSTEVYHYLQKHSLREHPVLKALREETRHLRWYVMQISPEQGQFMGLLIELMNAKKTLDIGTFTGYSALAVALALPDDGEVITCDVNPETAAIAERFFKQAGMQHKIALKLAPALDTLQQLIDDGKAGSFDFSFIDADKGNYQHYYEKSLALVRQGGLIAIDNVLWSGRVADPSDSDADTKAIRKLNDHLMHDERITLSMLPIGDGLTLARKR